MIIEKTLFRDTLGYLTDVVEMHRKYGLEIDDPDSRIPLHDLREAFSREFEDARREVRKIYSVDTNRAEQDAFTHGEHPSRTLWDIAAHRLMNVGFVRNAYTQNAILNTSGNGCIDVRSIQRVVKAERELWNVFTEARMLDDLERLVPLIREDMDTIAVFVNQKQLRGGGQHGRA